MTVISASSDTRPRLLSDRAARYTARLLVLVGWQLIGLLSDNIPTPIGTVQFIVDETLRGELWVHLTWTLRRAALALSAVLVLGVLIGWAMGRWWRVGAFCRDINTVLLALPAFIWALLAAIWWGFSEVGPFVVPVLAATPMLIASTFEGAKSLPKPLLEMSAAYRVSQRRTFATLVLPAMAPYIIAGFRYAVLAGWGALSLVEFFASNWGAGYRAAYWYDAGNFNGLMGWGLIEIAVILAVDRLILERLARWSRRWQEGTERW
ncbi:ABC transporter permease subunit [Mycobacterium sp. 236(2023)]|uniref:ABC transporter permease n=1 Tax=Mycobacterium sp. 236(2023) TaxID=3038163 RepID=UPI002415759D|nr:ABC transporter permease subunit [Mycobacterium sp. 236(2023)]MDG4663768.1 ABC transporter permease subunit [Mycobacterium sp. 236(2023)]